MIFNEQGRVESTKSTNRTKHKVSKVPTNTKNYKKLEKVHNKEKSSNKFHIKTQSQELDTFLLLSKHVFTPLLELYSGVYNNKLGSFVHKMNEREKLSDNGGGSKSFREGKSVTSTGPAQFDRATT